MGFSFSPSQNAYLMYCILVAPVLLLALVVLLLFGLKREVRQRGGWRVTIAIVGIAFLPALPAVLSLASMKWKDMQGDRKIAQYTFHPTTPTAYAGTLFPGGSTLVLDTYPPHQLESGSVPSATTVLELPLVDDFKVSQRAPESGGGFYISEGTLAAPARVQGVPCGPGMVNQKAVSVSAGAKNLFCILAEDYPLIGLIFRKGTLLSINIDPHYASFSLASIVEGTLARPAILSGIKVPAGTVVNGDWQGGDGETVVNTERPFGDIDLKLPDATDIALNGARIKGLCNLEIDEKWIFVESSGDPKQPTLFDEQNRPQHEGKYDYASRRWEWTGFTQQ